ncbi:barstar family protein [Paenibacillus sp. 19GGS1-52]|uniref:barstar family protein n=1 Tax=Paenibacillus sp. 19GGS1-52 TaxID=2758563 RepID=UPI001EFC18BB|nr:barstar family protein [Paenibacillus sp. 19GGS1-52]ULO04716.1 barstar family protein [Paenibacillus sp. 19GGS1-52]
MNHLDFLIIDDDSDLIVGTCRNILGMTREYAFENNSELFHTLIVENLQVEEEFKRYYQSTKASISNIYISILDNTANILGSYFFSLQSPFFFHKLKMEKDIISIELVGAFAESPSKEALGIWKIWSEGVPKSNNSWSRFTKEYRTGWLEVVRLHNSVLGIPKDQQNLDYDLDLTLVSDVVSFFCALGEAMNGPSGYYGYDLVSLKDCLCGGFGSKPPFTLYLRESNIQTQDFIQEQKVFIGKFKELAAVNTIIIRQE